MIESLLNAIHVLAQRISDDTEIESDLHNLAQEIIEKIDYFGD